jgi:hypothetical protein
LNQNRTLAFCFDAFSSREPVSTSLENAIVRCSRRSRLATVHGLSQQITGDLQAFA